MNIRKFISVILTAGAKGGAGFNILVIDNLGFSGTIVSRVYTEWWEENPPAVLWVEMSC